MEEEEEYLCKIETVDDNFYLLLQKVSQEGDGFDLSITDGNTMWNTKVTDDLLQKMAVKAEMNVKEHASQTLKALTDPNSGKDCFTYQAVKRESALEFNWKKQLPDGVKYQLGSIFLPLSEESKETMQKILNFAIRKIHKYEDNAVFMESKNKQLARDRDNVIKCLDKCVVSREEMELDLFQKFVTVLNDKKAKIRKLQEVIEQQAKHDSAGPEDPNLTDGHEKRIIKKRKERNDDTDMESDQSQNDETLTENSHATTPSNIGSSLFKDEEDTGPVVKRRRKIQRKQPSTTPSKPVLPEMKATVKRTVSNTSNNSTTSNESRQSSGITRRSSRRNKNSSTFPDDVENLFGDMA